MRDGKADQDEDGSPEFEHFEEESKKNTHRQKTQDHKKVEMEKGLGVFDAGEKDQGVKQGKENADQKEKDNLKDHFILLFFDGEGESGKFCLRMSCSFLT